MTPLPRNISRQDIECPGDTIPYRCSINSNSEAVQLMWRVTFPGQDTITIVYTNASDQNSSDFLASNVTSRLIQYRSNIGVESEIVLTVLQNVSMNGTLVECRSEDLDNDVVVVYINTSGRKGEWHFHCIHQRKLTYYPPTS